MITKYEIAKRLKISSQSVYKWYNGKSSPSVKNLIRLAKLLGLSTDAVLKLFK